MRNTLCQVLDILDVIRVNCSDCNILYVLSMAAGWQRCYNFLYCGFVRAILVKLAKMERMDKGETRYTY